MAIALDAPEHSGMLRLTELVEHLFRVPVAYMALLGPNNTVGTRIGKGIEYANVLRGARPGGALEEPQLVRDSRLDLIPGTEFADLRFAASALLRARNGVLFGVLVIAGREPRPDFSAEDFRVLTDIATVLSGNIELQTVAPMALEPEFSRSEHDIVDWAPVPIIYRRADGVCQFVNQAWLDFSGRTLEQELAGGWESLIHPSYRWAVMEEYWRSFEALRPFTAEAPLLRSDGQYRRVLCKGAPRFREDGSFAGYVGCLIDITGEPSVQSQLIERGQGAAPQ